jgi:peptidyl-prolyl cis-trans isomerase B (cyclophilin B)
MVKSLLSANNDRRKNVRITLLLLAGMLIAGMTLVQAKPKAPVAPTKVEIAAAKKIHAIQVKLVTSKGTIILKLDGSAAPVAVANFLNLVKGGFYDGMVFHRVEPGFVIQAGDPRYVGLPQVGYTIIDEHSPIKHTRGIIAMARTSMPNSATTQFYITLGDAPHLDSMGFAPFGRVTSGMNVADKIVAGDKIIKATVMGTTTVKKK